MKLFYRIRDLLFPPRCVLCRSLLDPREQDLCHSCRMDIPAYPFGFRNPEPKGKSNRHFLDSVTAIWYYDGNVRQSIRRFKFYRKRQYAAVYGRLLGMKILEMGPENVDLLTWVPVSWQRKMSRGYDQSQLLAQAVGNELGLEPCKLLRKVRHTSPQSRLRDPSMRKANALGAYKVIPGTDLAGKRILLLDDVFTTGATTEECARMLLSAGAGEVHCGAVAAAQKR